MKVMNVSISDDLRLQYESLLPSKTMSMFRWVGSQYMWADPNVINKDNHHWLSEINFGLRVFLKTIKMKDSVNS